MRAVVLELSLIDHKTPVYAGFTVRKVYLYLPAAEHQPGPVPN